MARSMTRLLRVTLPGLCKCPLTVRCSPAEYRVTAGCWLQLELTKRVTQSSVDLWKVLDKELATQFKAGCSTSLAPILRAHRVSD